MVAVVSLEPGELKRGHGCRAMPEQRRQGSSTTSLQPSQQLPEGLSEAGVGGSPPPGFSLPTRCNVRNRPEQEAARCHWCGEGGGGVPAPG